MNATFRAQIHLEAVLCSGSRGLTAGMRVKRWWWALYHRCLKPGRAQTDPGIGTLKQGVEAAQEGSFSKATPAGQGVCLVGGVQAEGAGLGGGPPHLETVYSTLKPLHRGTFGGQVWDVTCSRDTVGLLRLGRSPTFLWFRLAFFHKTLKHPGLQLPKGGAWNW